MGIKAPPPYPPSPYPPKGPYELKRFMAWLQRLIRFQEAYGLGLQQSRI